MRCQYAVCVYAEPLFCGGWNNCKPMSIVYHGRQAEKPDIQWKLNDNVTSKTCANCGDDNEWKQIGRHAHTHTLVSRLASTTRERKIA